MSDCDGSVLDRRLVRELLVVLALKLALLYALWFAFFRQPEEDALSAADVSRTFFNETARAETVRTLRAGAPQQREHSP